VPISAATRLGPYEVLAPLGAGGMGEVWTARDTRLDRLVAIKVLKEKFSERFEREARAVAALNHSNICTLHDVGPNYLVMEYIEGTTLKGPLPVDQALKYAAQICDALDAAHKRGITHRDLKPANILVTKAGVKLLDFGLAKIRPAIQAGEGTMTMALTGKGEILGTFQYMSPEQVTGQDAGPRSDIFSFGLVLYEMLTGKRAFEGSSPASVIAAIMERPAPSIADVVPPALDRVLQKCLAKDPDNRWQSARDLKDELEWMASAPESGSPGSGCASW
jgi:serine/threonine protein kinase